MSGSTETLLRRSARLSTQATNKKILWCVQTFAEHEAAGEGDWLNWGQFGRVRVQPSSAVPGRDTGNGLFAVTDFQPGDVISEYGGIVTDYRTDIHLDIQTHDAALPVPGSATPLYSEGSGIRVCTVATRSEGIRY